MTGFTREDAGQVGREAARGVGAVSARRGRSAEGPGAGPAAPERSSEWRRTRKSGRPRGAVVGSGEGRRTRWTPCYGPHCVRPAERSLEEQQPRRAPPSRAGVAVRGSVGVCGRRPPWGARRGRRAGSCVGRVSLLTCVVAGAPHAPQGPCSARFLPQLSAPRRPRRRDRPSSRDVFLGQSESGVAVCPSVGTAFRSKCFSCSRESGAPYCATEFMRKAGV